MSLNCIEIEKIIDILPKNGLLKKIYQIDKFTLIINIYDGKKEYFILGSIKDRFNRICLVPDSENIKKNILRFSQILNSILNNYKLINIYQYNYSRILVIELQSQISVKKLVFRLWGNGGNILLLDNDNNIIECLRRMPKRGEWPSEIFKFPEKKDDIKNFIIREEFTEGIINDNIYYYYDNFINNEEIDKKRKYLESIIKKDSKILEEKLKGINKNLSSEKENLYKKYGELLKNNLYKIKKGTVEVELDDYEEDKKIKIPLNTKLTPSENIENYFKLYKKCKNARLMAESDKKTVSDKLNELVKYDDLLKKINDDQILSDMEKKIKIFLNISIDKKLKEKKIPGRHFLLIDDYFAYVSRNAKEGHELLNSIAKGNDYWFHIRDYPGSHIIVKKNGDKDIGNKTKIEASNLAVYFSKCRNSTDADVYFTQIKYLHKSKGGPLGLVFPTKEKNIKVKYNKKIIDEIFKRSNI